ncbi:MAG: dTDP-4-dehydrorhamnose reductase [Armatimonadetes bacterium JP3_11]|jgi:dTDP-4-dehydrorhamnose reductase|nr:MAG: dTDP-4-dehydrorhamnose reductase [Armatimonadetes bacterium CP1_7O]OYT75945.1 MAG: dTDP-4-dehydrorhamnose reductase [Armatimonadetes bacterium JP3_11]RMH07915.1 MAG: dTDP-4-dehydrorhamnose reductase [Armatimonadota bacterium]
MRVLVTGAAGLLGAEVVERFRAANLEVVGAARRPHAAPAASLAEPLSGGVVALDITQPDAVRAVFDTLRPEVVVHCAAMTHVDACEHHPREAYRVNAFGAEVIASNCQRIGAVCVYISTDYVFDGSKRAPYHEYDAENPLSVYGRSKFAGEQAVRTLCPRHYIARVAWLYGKQRKSFPQFVLEQARAGNSPPVISDQIGSPTYVADVADRLLQLIQTDCYGTYHLTNTEPVSRYEFACALLQAAGFAIEPTPVPFKQWHTPAPRPAYSALISWRLEWAGVAPMPSWKDAMQRFLANVSS